MNRRLSTEEIELLSAWLDGEADNPAAVAALVESDPDMARWVAGTRAMQENLRAMPAPAASPPITERVMNALARTSGVEKSRRIPSHLRMAAAACALLAAGAVYLGLTTLDRPAPPAQPFTLEQAQMAAETLLDEHALQESESPAEPVQDDVPAELLVAALADWSLDGQEDAEAEENTGDWLDDAASGLEMAEMLVDEDAMALDALEG